MSMRIRFAVLATALLLAACSSGGTGHASPTTTTTARCTTGYCPHPHLTVADRSGGELTGEQAIKRVARLSSEIEPGATFHAKRSATGGWLVEVRGRVHPEFARGTYRFAVFTVDEHGDITASRLSNRVGPVAPGA